MFAGKSLDFVFVLKPALEKYRYFVYLKFKLEKFHFLLAFFGPTTILYPVSFNFFLNAYKRSF